ncbi:T9SS type A sorting domain-containing protein [Flavilitoribacter nigricans]|uniref:Secretion system C-terminal sorting domain-containing protein n=1 Tax=Flavilitoribacter nigricans (strain ATCC 23147 / DSM 23189 / NBRC 102662 / NCIMB 1420 / SS-2) TaxID=1122177 RepID=A0A2D0NCF5_FLAN2|nr:T9SS type A sorting domain-containing protein [Flavilitoribacter nigricans]PHN06194.1 hypothetical protein CRP01_11470 [Flavilitoribacter nigricans DSM 23189 = NBRC 102662]
MKLIRFYTLLALCFLSFYGVQAQNSSLCVPAEIAVREGDTTITCEPGAIMWIRFRTSRVNTPYGFIVTQEDGTILRVSISDKVSFDGLPGGNLRVYAFSYIGLVLAEEGGNIFDSNLASVCSAVSPNYIGVLNIVPEGGTVESGNGRSTEYICTDDELPDLLSFTTSEVNEPIYAYLVTDENDQLLSISEDGNVDFTNASQGVCRVYGIAYTGGLIVEAGQNIHETELAEGCYDVSDNYVSVVRTQPEGGTITADGGTEDVQACDYPEATNVVITLGNDNDQTFNYAYILSDEAETTFTVVEGNTINLSELPMGNSRVRGISFAGELTGASGTYPDFTDVQTGCFDISDNFITLTRTFVDGGQVALADGSTEVRPCGIDELPDSFSFQTTSTAQEGYAWILTGDNNFIKGIYTENLISIDEFDDEDDFRVRGLSYSGNILPVIGQELKEADLTDGCYQVSENFITITRIRPEGGSVTLADGSNAFTGCDSPDTFGQTILNLSNTGDAEFSYTYLLTDTDNNILQIIEGEAIPLSDLPKGTSRIWGLNYEGVLMAQPGDNAATATLVDGCSDLSDDFIEVERIVVDGGDLTILNGDTEALTCGNDDIPDAFTFTSTTTATDQPYVLVVTDVNNRVFSTVNGGIIDFDLFAPRTYRIWGLSYTGTLNVPFGSILTNIAPSDGCYDLSNSFATIRQEEVNGGQLQFTGGGTEKFTCPGDGNPDVLTYLHNGFSSDGYVYLVTDSDNIILATTTESNFDFDGAPEGICRIWGLAYSGTLNAPVGEQADTLLFSNECYSLSENFLQVVREVPTGGTIDLVDGDDIIYTCPGDGQSDILEFTTNSTYPGIYIYLITTEDNRVLDVSFTGKYDFDFAEPGNCRVYGVAFTGNWIIQSGSLITEDPLSDDCWGISDNFITVVRETPTGGAMTFADGSDIQYTCPGDGRSDLLEFSSDSDFPGSFIYLITNENNELLMSTTEPSFDFDEADLGTCRIYGLAYTGDLLVQTGDDITQANLSDDCFDLSGNYLSVVRDTPDAGTISTPGGDNLTLCVGDAFADVVQLSVEGASNSQYAYLITDESGFLIAAITDTEFDFNNAVGGICRIYGMAYTGEIIAVPGDNINDVPVSSDCFSISENFITLNRLSVDGSTIFTGSGSTDVEYVCSGDGVADPITFQNGNNDPQVNYQYLITTATNSILGEVNGNTIDVEGSPFDTLRIWGVAYIGTPTLPIGMDITTVMLSDSCYDTSDNYITLINGLPEGGMISDSEGSTDLRVCIGGTSGIVDFATTSTAIVGYTYIITTPDSAILGTAEAGTVDFNTYEVGDYLVHGLSYTGSLNFEVGDTLDQVDLATSCYELSTNSVQVERTPPLDAGTITSAFGNPLYVCLDDGMGDIGAFETTSTDPNYRFVITDTLNNILIPDIGGNVVDFNKANPGFFRVWGVSFTGDFIAGFGMNILEAQLSDQCSAVSANYISLVNDHFDGGTVSTEDGETEISIISGDGIEDVIAFDSTGTSGVSYTYVITDENNAILGVPAGDTQDFEGASEGICRVWGLSYSGEVIAEVGDTLGQVMMSSGCFVLSENFVMVERVGPGSPYVIQVPFNTVTNRLKLQLYPNPVSKSLNIHLKALFEDLDLEGAISIEVFDLSGRRLIGRQENMVEQVSTFTLDVEELPIGMYVLRVTNGGTSAQQRFFRQ